MFVGWLFNVPATCYCISGTDLLRQLYSPGRVATGVPFLSHWYDSTPIKKKSRRKRDSNPGSSALEADALPLGQRGGQEKQERSIDTNKHTKKQESIGTEHVRN